MKIQNRLVVKYDISLTLALDPSLFSAAWISFTNFTTTTTIIIIIMIIIIITIIIVIIIIIIIIIAIIINFLESLEKKK